MKEQTVKYFKQIMDFWKSLSKKTKKISVIAAVMIAASAIVISVFLNNDPYVALYSGISTSEASEIMTKLDGLSVDYKWSGGNIEVRSKQADQVKLKLAVEGYPKSGLSYDIFTNNIDLMSTDFEKNSYKVFQLQERLRETIKLMSGIEDAVVTIAVPQQNNYVWKEDEAKASASVVLKTLGEGTISSQQIAGIVQLVSKSIPGLSVQDVAVVDNYGNDLTENSNEVDFSQLKLDIEKQMEMGAKSKIANVLYPIYGENNVRISVKSVVDVTKKISESVNYVPNGETDRGVIESEQNARESTGSSSESNGIPGTESNTQVPTYPIVGKKEDGTMYVKDQNSYEYLVSSIKEQIQSESPEQKDMTIAIAINKSEMSPEDKENIAGLVAAATATDSKKVVVHNTVFEGQNTATVPISQNKDIYIIAVAALATVVMLLAVFLLVRKKKKNKTVNLNDEATLYYNMNNRQVRPILNDDKQTEDKKAPESNYKDLNDLDPTDLQQLQSKLQELTSSNAEIMAKLIQSWLKGDEGRIEQ